MSEFNEKVLAAKSLIELCETLNGYKRDENDDYSNGLSDATDLTDLPLFGGDEPSDTDGIFSWDKNNLLIDNSEILEGDDWKIISREEKKIETYQVFLKDTDLDSTFFNGEAESEKQAIEFANKAYFDKYPEEAGNTVEWEFAEDEDE